MADRPQSQFGFFSHRTCNDADQDKIIRPFFCEHCNMSFVRKEHLERHMGRHLRSGPFSCPQCSKSFPRRDSLKRHFMTHGTEVAQLLDTMSTGQSKRAARACANCMRSKQRCHGGPPCERCKRKGFGCVYSSLTELSRKLANDPQLLSEGQDRPILTHGELDDSIGQKRSANARERTPSTNNAFLDSSVETVYTGLPTNDLDSQRLADTTFLQETGPVESLTTLSIQQVTDFSVDDSMEVDLLYPFPWPVDFMESVGAFSRANSQGNVQTPVLGMQQASPKSQENFDPNDPRTSNKSSQETRDEHGSRTQHPVISFPALKPFDLQCIAADRFGHLSHIPEKTIDDITQFCMAQGNHFDAAVDETPFPAVELLMSLVDLFFEHFNPTIPIIHQATFNPTGQAWILLLGMAAIGSQYSSLNNREQFGTAFLNLLQRAISEESRDGLSIHANLTFAQAILLLQFCLMFSSTKQGIIDLQCKRTLLVTLLRPLLARQGSVFRSSHLVDSGEHDCSWHDWIVRESWVRLTYFTWFFECLQQILLDLQPMLTIHELHQSLPSSERLWECSSSEEWQSLKCREKDPMTLVDILSSTALTKDTLSALSDAGRLTVLLSIYVEERRALQLSTSWLYTQRNDAPDDQERVARGTGAGSYQWATSRNRALQDQIFSYFEPDDRSTSTSQPLNSLIQKFSHLIFILRRVPLAAIYTFSGWMASAQEKSAAGKQLDQWVKNHKDARECLVHAAALFQSVRSEMTSRLFDTWHLLIASLYIWTFTKLTDHDLQPPTSMYTPGPRPLRLDKPLDAATMRAWLEETPILTAHITGIGLLTDADSASRTLKEAIRVMRRPAPWASLSHEIARTLEEVLYGLNPSLPD